MAMTKGKKKQPDSLDGILQRLNEAEKEFKNIYDSVDFESFKANVKDEDDSNQGKNENGYKNS